MATTQTTISELVNVLKEQGVHFEVPKDVQDTQEGSASRVALDRASEALSRESWTVLHSGASDYILAGPVSALTPDNVTQAIVEHQARLAGETETPEGRGRVAGGFSCTHCGKFNLLRISSDVQSSQRWYCVAVGRDVGVFQGSQLANSLIQKVSGGSHEGFNTKEEAEIAYANAKSAGVVRKVTPEGSVTIV
ncbi:hypothetical protein EST38_g12686 [Candolleomyces aberdarensis]|uniref:Ribonuclease H1 N-terminal domain-containing protein n=1 Tax=Candolleomyces aberdarensis TaxID=2316362 RepID=A0A4Q2D3V4_9AGAR|nr:hypothetical protein EST38_g12686 [Candolleomyces aberdarensis]